jgi:hypothetical protein
LRNTKEAACLSRSAEFFERNCLLGGKRDADGHFITEVVFLKQPLHRFLRVSSFETPDNDELVKKGASSYRRSWTYSRLGVEHSRFEDEMGFSL